MGEYYNWVNVDRKEYICPADFDLGNKLLESSAPHNAFLCAFRELLANEWRGSHVVFLGDSQALTRDEDNATLKTLYDHSVESGYEGVGIDTVAESYKNISAVFLTRILRRLFLLTENAPDIRPTKTVYISGKADTLTAREIISFIGKMLSDTLMLCVCSVCFKAPLNRCRRRTDNYNLSLNRQSATRLLFLLHRKLSTAC